MINPVLELGRVIVPDFLWPPCTCIHMPHTQKHTWGWWGAKEDGGRRGRERERENVRIHGVVPQAIWEEWVYLPYSLQYFTKTGHEPKAGPRAEAMEECCWLACSQASFSYLSHAAQDLRPMGSIAPSELDLPMAIINKIPADNMIEAFPQLRYLLPDKFVFVKLT